MCRREGPEKMVVRKKADQHGQNKKKNTQRAHETSDCEKKHTSPLVIPVFARCTDDGPLQFRLVRMFVCAHDAETLVLEDGRCKNDVGHVCRTKEGGNRLRGKIAISIAD